MTLQPLWTLGVFQFLNLYTVGSTPWRGDQPLAMPLPIHRTTQTQNKHTDIHASSGIRTNDASVRAGEDGSCLRSRGHCDRYSSNYLIKQRLKSHYDNQSHLSQVTSRNSKIICYNSRPTLITVTYASLS
jgi:hypothetical protein